MVCLQRFGTSGPSCVEWTDKVAAAMNLSEAGWYR
jgi:hypothetical protein